MHVARLRYTPVVPFTLACAQFAPEKAEVGRNIGRIAEFCAQACDEGADIVAFPEACVSGYFLEGGVADVALSAEALASKLAEALVGKLPRALDAVVGFYERSQGILYNSAAYLELDGGRARVAHVYRKFFLPTYGVFDEERFVSRGTELGVFPTRLGTIGLLICEDVWHSILPTLLAVRGAELILVPSASPGRGFAGPIPENLDRYRRMIRAVAEEHGVYAANVHLCGFEGGKGFVGGSMVFDPFGKLVAESPMMDEHLLLSKIDLDLIAVARAQSPLLSDLRSSWANILRLAEHPGRCDEP